MTGGEGAVGDGGRGGGGGGGVGDGGEGAVGDWGGGGGGGGVGDGGGGAVGDGGGEEEGVEELVTGVGEQLEMGGSSWRWGGGGRRGWWKGIWRWGMTTLSRIMHIFPQYAASNGENIILTIFICFL